MNIFETIKSVTSRQEPFHSRFLADALNTSVDGDAALFRAVWHLVAKPAWEAPEDAKVIPEKRIGGGKRVDVVIVSESPVRRVVGIEVKTAESSVKEGQMGEYLVGLCAKFPEHKVQMAYLTPFNKERAGEFADTFRSIREFNNFSKDFPSARHGSWLDIADISWDDNELWKQHQAFVHRHISGKDKLQHTRDRELGSFFGEENAAFFWRELCELNIKRGVNGACINLDAISEDLTSFTRSLLQAFEILLKGENVSTNICKPDAFADDLRCRFQDSDYREVHRELFGFANQHPCVWIEGSRDYAVRVAHRNHRSGVSLLRTSGPDVLLTGQPR